MINEMVDAWSYLLLILAVPLHVIVIYTILKYRKTEFDSPFYILAVSLLINDCYTCLTILFWFMIWRVQPG